MLPDNSTLPDGRAAYLPLPIPFIPGAAIFDCDGTLADTMPLHYRAWREILDTYGCPFPEEQFYSWGGVTASEVFERLNRQHGLSMPVHEATDAKEAVFARLLPEATPIVKVIDDVRRLHGACPLAVASGGLKPLVVQTLIALGILELFVTIATADDVPHGKPAPDMFLLCAERMGVEPKSCVVYEDGPAGIVGAHAADMQVINVVPYL